MLATALTMSCADAQNAGGMGGGGHKRNQQSSNKTETKKPVVDEKAYSAALKSLPDKPFDPWSGTR
jgi:hypothetical protein